MSEYQAKAYFILFVVWLVSLVCAMHAPHKSHKEAQLFALAIACVFLSFGVPFV